MSMLYTRMLPFPLRLCARVRPADSCTPDPEPQVSAWEIFAKIPMKAVCVLVGVVVCACVCVYARVCMRACVCERVGQCLDTQCASCCRTVQSSSPRGAVWEWELAFWSGCGGAVE